MSDPSGLNPQPSWGPPPGQPGFQAPATPPGWGTSPAAVGVQGGLYQHQPSGLMLPDGTDLASVGRRIGAWFLAIPLFIVTLGIGYIVWGLIVWGRGQTPALQVLGMRCYRPETNKVAGWGYMALREIVGQIVDGILSIITQIISFVLFAARSDHKSLNDLIAGTVVLHDPNKVLANR